MKWEEFYHPDICLPVIRRRVGDELMELLFGLGGAMLSRGWSLLAEEGGQKASYHSAVYRLRKAGLIVRQGTERLDPVFELTDQGCDRLAGDLKPEKFWDVKWSGRWHLLVYDVPESERSKRDVLRSFLQRMRMGCFQKSVWVTPHDIRPMYADLCEASRIDNVSHLFEARTVLGCPSSAVVETSWNFDRLGSTQEHYCRVYRSNLEMLKSGPFSMREIMQLARDEMTAYRAAMAEDPLLPRVLWPPHYRGAKVWKLHKQMQGAIRKKLASSLLSGARGAAFVTDAQTRDREFERQ